MQLSPHKTLKQTYPGATIDEIVTRPQNSYEFGLTQAEKYFQVFVDPGTGQINGDYRQNDWIMG
jgi:hypothetical protein